jgi:hypothetical protein
VRGNWLRLVIVLVFVLLAAFVLVACETVGTPQPTATPGASTPVPTKNTTPGTPAIGTGYPTLPVTSAYPNP